MTDLPVAQMIASRLHIGCPYPYDERGCPCRVTALGIMVDLTKAGHIPAPGEIPVPVEALRTVLDQRQLHAHARPGIWDWDNGSRANQPCDECAARESLRAALQGQQP